MSDPILGGRQVNAMQVIQLLCSVLIAIAAAAAGWIAHREEGGK